MQKTEIITPELMEQTYQECLERERKRNYKYRHTKQGAFESSFVRFEQLLDDPNAATDKLRFAGTLGAVISEPDQPSRVVVNQHKLKIACQKLRRHGLGHLVRTLQLIAKNGNNREASICEMMKDMKKHTTQLNGVTDGNAINSAGFSGSNLLHPKKI